MRKVLTFLLIAFMATTASVYRKFLQSSDELNAEREKSQQLAKQVESLQTALEAERSKNQHVISVDLQSLQDLQKKLSAQKDATENAKQRWEDAKANTNAEEIAELKDKLAKEKIALEELRQEQQASLKSESQIGSQTRLSVQQERAQEKQEIAQLDQQIAAEQAQVQQTNQAIQSLRGAADVASRAQLTQYRQQLADQKGALQLLSTQKKSLAQQWEAQVALTQSSGQSQEGGTKQSAAQIQGALQLEQGRYQQIQQELTSAQQESQNSSTEAARLESEYQLEKSKQENLEKALADAQSKLR